MKNFISLTPDLARNLWGIPMARARIHGAKGYESIEGEVRFYKTNRGVIVNVELKGMPYDASKCAVNFHAFHIHEGRSCTGNEQDQFANVGMHYNPENCKHPAHRGDLLPLISSKGYVWENFLMDTFSIEEIIGRTVIIHQNPDDFKTQPSGDAGSKIACGEIKM